jgi:N-acetylmuramoyl-L-alanine amidase CwlA
MAKDYIGVKQDKKNRTWKYSLIKKGNKRASYQKQEFESAKTAAFFREMHILRDKLDTDEKGNKRNFLDKKLRKLNKKRKKISKGKIFGMKKVVKKKDTQKKETKKPDKKKKK